jgi:hypothetical protein
MPVLVPGDSDGPLLDTGDAFVAPIQVVAASATSQSFK